MSKIPRVAHLEADAPRRFDIRQAEDRRRFFLDAVRRRGSRGAGSDLNALLRQPPRLHDLHGVEMFERMFVDLPFMLIGAHAVAAFAPERMTDDVDYFTSSEHYSAGCAALRRSGFLEIRGLAFSTSRLGLYGSAWRSEGSVEVDVIASDLAWATEALSAPIVRNASGDRVMPLAYLVLMKIDAARSVDQGDLSRMLGRLSEEELTAILRIIEAHYSEDPAALEDVRQYAEIGRWEYGL